MQESLNLRKDQRELAVGDYVWIVTPTQSYLYPIATVIPTITFSYQKAGNTLINTVDVNGQLRVNDWTPSYEVRFVSKELASTVSLIPFDASSTQNDFSAVKAFLQNPEVMKNVRNGEIWTDDKIRTYLSYFNSAEDSKFMDRKICYNGFTIGIVGIRSDFDLLGPQFVGWPFVWIAIDQKYWGKGIGKAALNLAISTYQNLYPDKKQILSLIASDNLPSLKIHENVGFKLYQETVLHGRPHRLMVYSKPA